MHTVVTTVQDVLKTIFGMFQIPEMEKDLGRKMMMHSIRKELMEEEQKVEKELLNRECGVSPSLTDEELRQRQMNEVYHLWKVEGEETNKMANR